MTAKIPTARGISGLLGRAGYDRYKTTLTRVWPGYRVTTDAPGKVRVDHAGGGDRDGMRDQYAAAIRKAGWTVEERDHCLLVTAKGNGNG